MNETAASEVSPDMTLMPVVTQFQLALDMALANTAPDGQGHAHDGPDDMRPWVAVTAPGIWLEADSARAAHCDSSFCRGCRNGRRGRAHIHVLAASDNLQMTQCCLPDKSQR